MKPLRWRVKVFAAMENPIVPLPVPEVGPLKAIQVAPVDAVQEQEGAAVTVIIPELAEGLKEVAENWSAAHGGS